MYNCTYIHRNDYICNYIHNDYTYNYIQLIDDNVLEFDGAVSMALEQGRKGKLLHHNSD